MKKINLLLISIFVLGNVYSQNLDIILLNKSDYRNLNKTADTLTIVQQKDADNVCILKLKMLNTTADVNARLSDNEINTATLNTDYKYSVRSLPVNIAFDSDGNHEQPLRITVPKGESASEDLYAELNIAWSSLLDKDKTLHKQLVIKIIKKAKDKEAPKAEVPKTGRVDDPYNYFKAEVVQYTDISNIKNDKPNGLLQFQGIVKIPLNHHKTITKSGWFHQSMRAVLLDVLLNRIDKSKDEVDYNYTTYLYENDKAKKSNNPWLSTTDIWRFSNLHVGVRLVPLTVGKKDFRVQFQTGLKLLKSLPYSEDTIRSGIDSGKVKSDFRSVYSFTKYIELYFKYYNAKDKINLSLNTGVMWLKLLDSYYEQIDIYQQDPFQKAIALSPVTESRKSHPMWFVSLRAGKALGKEETVSAFLRLNYTLQKGTYYKPLTTVLDGRPVPFEKKWFYNNFFQVHFGTTFDLDNIFSKKEEDKKKGDGPISNTNQ